MHAPFHRAAERPAHPILYFVLMLPYGISTGFLAVAFPFVLTRAGLPVSVVAGILAVALLPNTWRFLGGPLVDLTLSLRRWYALGVAGSALSLLLLVLAPARPGAVALLVVLALLSQVAANLSAIPVGGMMAHGVAHEAQGRAAGWNQAGNLAGSGFAAGAGVWMSSHASPVLAGAVLAVSVLACLAALPWVPAVAAAGTETLGERLRDMGRHFREMATSAEARLVILVFLCPIGVGAAALGLWAAVAPAWRASDDQVALATGPGFALAAAAGCVAGGWLADRAGRWSAFFTSGASMAAVGVVMALAPRTPYAFVVGVICYSFTTGLSFAAFGALALHAVGRGAAATKYALLSSLANIPGVYMTAVDGWAHGRFGPGGMLMTEALLALAFVAPTLALLGWIRSAPRRAAPGIASIQPG